MKHDGDGRATARFFSGKGRRRRLRFTRPCRAWPCGFSVMWPPCRVRAVPCLHLSRAGGDARVRFAAAVTRSLLPVCRDFPAGRPRKRVRPLQLPPAVCVRLRLPLRPCIPALSPGFYGGTAQPGVAEYVNNGGKHHAVCETCHPER